MSLSPGKRLGVYEIVGLIGAGGMSPDGKLSAAAGPPIEDLNPWIAVSPDAARDGRLLVARQSERAGERPRALLVENWPLLLKVSNP